MALSDQDRSHVVDVTVDLLRHRHRGRLLGILERRLARGLYDDEHEKELDQVALAIAHVLDEEFEAVGS